MRGALPRRRRTTVAALLTLLGACECGESLSGPDGGAAGLECVGANDCPLGSYCSEFGRCVESAVLPDDGSAPPPENEQEAQRPASGDRFVYVAMTDLDTVARIDSETLDITTVPTGDQPGAIATAPGQDLAVVINHGSESLTVIRTDDGVDAVTTLPTLPRLNRLEMDPLGRHAIAFFELLSADATDVGSFQDVVVVDLAAGEERVTSVTVGFRPRRVVFHPDGTQAYVHTDDGVSIVDLADDTADFVAPLVPLSGAAFGDDPLADHQPLEVVVARDGSRAFARFTGERFVRAVSLADGSWVDVPLAAPPSDIDLTGEGDALVAVVRPGAAGADAGTAVDASSLVLVPLPAGLIDAAAVVSIDLAPLAAGLVDLTADSTRAVVFTNAASEKAIGVVDLAAATLAVVPLRKAVSSVVISPDDAKVVVVHNKAPGDPQPTQDFDAQLQHRHGFSVVDLESGFAKLELTEARPGPHAFSTDDGTTTHVHLVVADPALDLKDVVAVDLLGLLATTIPMSSHPTGIGAVPSSRQVFVAQSHDVGRMSFIAVDDREVRTVTGFQLNSRITE